MIRLPDAKASLVEIMVSVQGEGPWVGCRQGFLRFVGCNLACSYCDTPGGRRPWQQACRVERDVGSGEFEHWPNPIEVLKVSKFLSHELPYPIHSLSLTGGEPLLHGQFIRSLADTMGKRRPAFYLETNGTLPNEFAAVIDCIEYVSMDIKLPTEIGQAKWEEHQQFLRLAASKEGFVKVVIAPSTEQFHVLQASHMVNRIAPHYPLVLQPMTDNNGLPAVHQDKLLSMQSAALSEHKDVRIIPQTHKYLGFL